MRFFLLRTFFNKQFNCLHEGIATLDQIIEYYMNPSRSDIYTVWNEIVLLVVQLCLEDNGTMHLLRTSLWKPLSFNSIHATVSLNIVFTRHKNKQYHVLCLHFFYSLCAFFWSRLYFSSKLVVSKKTARFMSFFFY